MIASIEPTTPSAAPADWQAGQSIRTTGLGTHSDVRSRRPYLPRSTHRRPSSPRQRRVWSAEEQTFGPDFCTQVPPTASVQAAAKSQNQLSEKKLVGEENT